MFIKAGFKTTWENKLDKFFDVVYKFKCKFKLKIQNIKEDSFVNQITVKLEDNTYITFNTENNYLYYEATKIDKNEFEQRLNFMIKAGETIDD